MTKLANETPPRNFPKAKAGDHWLAAWKCGAITDDAGRLQQRPSLTVIYGTKGFHSKLGAGNTRLAVATIPLGDDGSSLAATLGASTGIGSASVLNRPTFIAIVENCPDVTELGGLAAVARSRLHDLASLDQLGQRSRASYSQRDGWQWCGIPHETYGYAFLPKASAGNMKRVEGAEIPADLATTHVLVDVLGTKHALMEELGLNSAIEYDKRQIGNSLRLEEESRR